MPRGSATGSLHSTVDIKDPQLIDLLEQWQHFYNGDRAHGALKGKTPIERYCELIYRTPVWEEVGAMYDETKEHIQEADYNKEISLRKLKGSV